MPQFDLPPDQLADYRPEVREPDDFDAFWADTLARSREVPMDVSIQPAPVNLALVDIADLTFPGFDGHPVRAWYLRPRGVDEPLPCVVHAPGYGGGRGLPMDHLMWPAAGYATVYMDVRGQGAGWGAGGSTADPVGSGPASPGVMTRGVLDPRQYYYRRVFTDAVRAVDAARSLPGVDATAVVFAGGSQAGGIALAVAGLVPDLAAVMADVPFLCHFERAIAITDDHPYREIVTYLASMRVDRDTVLTTLAYVDGVNHAKRAQAPALMSVALRDTICPPSTVYAAYHWYGAHYAPAVDKSIVEYPDNGHEGGGAHQQLRQLDFLTEVLARS